VVVGDFNLVDIAVPPIKADSILVVDPNAMLPFPISTKTLQPVSGRDREFLKIANAIQLVQFSTRCGPQFTRACLLSRACVGAVEHVLGALIPK
jgi:hypothetical protein